MAFPIFGTARSKGAPWRLRQVPRIIRLATRSRITHCSIAYNGVFLTRGLKGTVYLPLRTVLRLYPGMCAIFAVPFRYDIDLAYFEYGVGYPMPLWPTALRWLQRGRGPLVHDCLGVVMACLQAGGISVPRAIHSPVGLYRFLKGEGYAYATDEQPHFRDAARQLVADRMARPQVSGDHAERRANGDPEGAPSGRKGDRPARPHRNAEETRR